MLAAGRRLPQPPAVGVLAVAAAGNAGLAAILAARGVPVAVVLAVLPAALVAFGALVASSRALLLFTAVALSIIAPPVVRPLPLQLPGRVYSSDLVILLILAGWTAARLAAPPGRKPEWPRAPVLGWPFLFFAAAMLSAALRGHVEHGANLVGQPVRLVLYAAVAFAMTQVTYRQVHRGLVAVLYLGTAWMLVNAAYYRAAGQYQTDQVFLSTGGARTLSLTVAMYLASALILSLLNLQLETHARWRALHLTVAGLAAFGVVLAFGRATFAALAVVLPLLVVGFGRIREALLGLLPLCLPFVLLAAIAVPRALPDVGPTFVDRVTTPAGVDKNVRWREEASKAVLAQVRESPVVGVGFGKDAVFTFDRVRQSVDQDPHNSFLYLLAGGGAAALGSFLLIVAVSAVGAWRRFLRAAAEERVLVAWSSLTLFVFLVNAASAPVFSDPIVLLTIWALLLVPFLPRDPPSPRGSLGSGRRP